MLKSFLDYLIPPKNKITFTKTSIIMNDMEHSYQSGDLIGANGRIMLLIKDQKLDKIVAIDVIQCHLKALFVEDIINAHSYYRLHPNIQTTVNFEIANLQDCNEISYQLYELKGFYNLNIKDELFMALLLFSLFLDQNLGIDIPSLTADDKLIAPQLAVSWEQWIKLYGCWTKLF
jgi:hypothetical protein